MNHLNSRNEVFSGEAPEAPPKNRWENLKEVARSVVSGARDALKDLTYDPVGEISKADIKAAKEEYHRSLEKARNRYHLGFNDNLDVLQKVLKEKFPSIMNRDMGHRRLMCYFANDLGLLSFN